MNESWVISMFFSKLQCYEDIYVDGVITSTLLFYWTFLFSHSSLLGWDRAVKNVNSTRVEYSNKNVLREGMEEAEEQNMSGEVGSGKQKRGRKVILSIVWGIEMHWMPILTPVDVCSSITNCLPLEGSFSYSVGIIYHFFFSDHVRLES